MSPDQKKPEKSEFVDALQKGALLGLALLVLILPPLRMMQDREAAQAPTQQMPAAQPPLAQGGATAPPTVGPAPAVPPSIAQNTPRAAPGAGPDAPAVRPSQPAPSIRLADFRGEEPSSEARQVANWAVFTRDHKKHAFVVIDKKDARVYLFGPDGKLADSTPALLGSARGDDSAPGVGDKPLSALKPEEKTTPAGRFVAEAGLNTHGEDIVWIDYDAAVSMHRIRPLPGERRLERLASRTIEDNRISNGCVNLPVTFYEGVLTPAVKKHGVVVYVLPEKRSVQQVFGAFDPEAGRVQQVAFHAPAR